MIRGMYSAASALDTATLNQELVAENLANANSPGYRRQGIVFEAIRQGAGDPASLTSSPGGSTSLAGMTPAANAGGMRKASVYTNFDPGPVQQTGNPLDLTLSNNVYFVLEGPQGPLYTRNGTFELNGQGQLQSKGGLPVKSVSGRLSIPPTASQITVSSDGTVLADRTELGRLQIAEFTDPTVLQRAGTSLFQGPNGRQPDPGTYRVEQGYREGSNVQIVNEMVAMMTGMRHYEAAQKALHALGDAEALNTRPQ